MRFCEKSLQVIFLIFWMKLQQHKCFKVPKKTSNKKAQKNVLFLIFLGTKVVWIVIEMKFQGFMKSQFMELFWFFCMMSLNEIIIFLEKSCFSEFLMHCVIMVDLFLSYIIYWFYLLWFPILIFVNFLLFKRSFKSSFWLNISSFVIKTYIYIIR